MLRYRCVLLPEKQLAPVRPSQTRIANAMPLADYHRNNGMASLPPIEAVAEFVAVWNTVKFLWSGGGGFRLDGNNIQKGLPACQRILIKNGTIVSMDRQTGHLRGDLLWMVGDTKEHRTIECGYGN